MIMAIDWSTDTWTALGGLGAAATAVVAIGTLLFAARDSRLRTRPVVVAEYRLPGNIPFALELVIRNTGASVARDVAVTFSPDLATRPETSESLHPFIVRRYQRRIANLGPGQELTNVIHVDASDPESNDVPEVLTVSISYKRWLRRRYREHYVLDYTVYVGHTFVTSSDSVEGRLLTISKSLAEIATAMKPPIDHEAAKARHDALVERVLRRRGADAVGIEPSPAPSPSRIERLHQRVLGFARRTD